MVLPPILNVVNIYKMIAQFNNCITFLRDLEYALSDILKCIEVCNILA